MCTKCCWSVFTTTLVSFDFILIFFCVINCRHHNYTSFSGQMFTSESPILPSLLPVLEPAFPPTKARIIVLSNIGGQRKGSLLQCGEQPLISPPPWPVDLLWPLTHASDANARLPCSCPPPPFCTASLPPPFSPSESQAEFKGVPGGAPAWTLEASKSRPKGAHSGTKAARSPKTVRFAYNHPWVLQDLPPGVGHIQPGADDDPCLHWHVVYRACIGTAFGWRILGFATMDGPATPSLIAVFQPTDGFKEANFHRSTKPLKVVWQEFPSIWCCTLMVENLPW